MVSPRELRACLWDWRVTGQEGPLVVCGSRAGPQKLHVLLTWEGRGREAKAGEGLASAEWRDGPPYGDLTENISCSKSGSLQPRYIGRSPRLLLVVPLRPWVCSEDVSVCRATHVEVKRDSSLVSEPLHNTHPNLGVSCLYKYKHDL